MPATAQGPLVTISADRYAELLASERKLGALESHGVDSWDWYGDAMASLADEEDE